MYPKENVKRIIAGFLLMQGIKQDRGIDDPVRLAKMVAPFCEMNETTLEAVADTLAAEMDAAINQFGAATEEPTT